MDSRNNMASGGAGDGIDWTNISMYNNAPYDETMTGESPYGTSSAFNDLTNYEAYGDSLGHSLRTPSKSGPDAVAGAAAQNTQHAPGTTSMSAESSSQDSSSDTSSQRKRKTKDSESPVSDPVTELGRIEAHNKQEDVHMAMGGMKHVRSFDNNFARPMHNLSLEQSMGHGDGSMNQFDFNSAASSPIQTRDFNTAMSLDAHMNTAAPTQFNQESPIQTINPGMFSIGASRDQSPATNNMMFNQTSASPHGIFSTPSSDTQDAFAAHQNWNQALAQNTGWQNDYSNQLTSPGAMGFTPSPSASGGTLGLTGRRASTRLGRSPLHIAPISTKSRVETQINVLMTLEKPPAGIEHLHLPLHTIAKSKLLAKEEYEKPKVLELYTMLVCTSAMHNPQFKEKALQRAAAANNEEIQHRAELARDSNDEEKNDPKNVPDEEKPANGGEVRICNNCIQRERKRAGRKKTKREEEQQHWERFETERVVVFNSNEYLPFKAVEPGQQAAKDEDEKYDPPEGAMQATAAMRIACYCRHQSEKEGFQVIFTLKDQYGNVIAQQLSDSILITDDHKTHPPSFSTPLTGGEGYYANAAYMSNSLPMSQSLVDMTAHPHAFTSSRSAGNLQALSYQGQFSPHSHVHQVPGSGFASQATSATMTPTTLSRPGSPTNAGHAGPNKKRKSSTFHRKIPSGLTMTPRVDTSQPPSSNLPSANSVTTPFSPGFPGQMNQASYMTMANNSGSAQFFGSGPPTPNESGPFNFNNPSQVDISRTANNNQAYFSHPSSAVPSRASSPVLQQTRANMAAYARQQPIQTSTNTIGVRQQMFVSGVPPGSASGNNRVNHGPYPIISRLVPDKGPISGGNEVAIFGEHFVSGMTVSFADYTVPAQCLSPTSLITIAPPGHEGPVLLTLKPPGYPHGPISPYPDAFGGKFYNYTQGNEEMMVMALKYLSQQQSGNKDAWHNFAQQKATSYIQSEVSLAGIQQQQQQQQQQSYAGGHRMVA